MGRYAGLFAQVIRDEKDLRYKVHCGCSQELKLDALASRRAEIVRKVVEAEQKPAEEAKHHSKNCCSFFRSSCCQLGRESSDDSHKSLLLQSS